jgi:hypothetical protein
MLKSLKKFTGLFLFGAALLGVTSSAKAQVAPSLPPTWKVNVTGDAAAKAAGRKDFVEFVYIESTSFSGDQICKLGMQQTALSLTAGTTTGTYNVSCTMHSNTQGDVTFAGTVSSTQMSGTISWVIGGTTYTYTYNGVPYTPDPSVQP